MREILFRGKCGYSDEWVEGFYYQAKLYRSDKELCHYITIPHPESDGQPSDHIMVHPETVGQFTGLTDKNGKRIFEGDILKIAKVKDGIGGYSFPPLPYPVDTVVKWDFCAWMWETLCDDKRYISFPDAWCHYECEVIGNIHDNPELLENP